MARRPQPRPQPRGRGATVESNITLGTLVNSGGIPLITAVVLFAGFYYLTNYRLDQYAVEIKTINTKIEQAGKLVSDKTADDTQQREKIREAFLSAQSKTNEGIAKLDTRLAVAEQQQKTANETLTKISDSLQKFTTQAVSSGRR